MALRGAAGVVVGNKLDTRAHETAGSIEISSSAGDVLVQRPLFADARRHAGDVIVVAAGDAILSPRRIGATGETGGAIRATASGGSLTLDGKFVARGSGTIEASASGDLLAEGAFRCAPAGCIALSAGGTLDTSAATFDKAPVADCPGP